MRTIRRLIYREILASVGFVLLAFLSLFLFFDLVDEIGAIGRASPLDPELVYELHHALFYVALKLVNRVYELMPIAVLIGAVFVLARLAQSSEYTILRTSGLGPWRALVTLLGLGAIFVALTFALGDFLAPQAERSAQVFKARFEGRLSIGQTGAWLKERQADRHFSVNIGAMLAPGELSHVRLFEFAANGHLLSITQAPLGHIAGGAWRLENAERRLYGGATNAPRAQAPEASNAAVIERQQLAEWSWPSAISAEMVSVALLRPERMGTADLYNYVRHLRANEQSAQRHEIEFWRKVFYPLSCLVMVVLALPFAYLHFRSTNLTGYVFAGVMIGISFFLLNNVFGYVGNLQQWPPWLAAAAPSLLYSALSLGAFGWLVLRR